MIWQRPFVVFMDDRKINVEHLEELNEVSLKLPPQAEFLCQITVLVCQYRKAEIVLPL